MSLHFSSKHEFGPLGGIVIRRQRSQNNMGSCPYCRSTTLPSDTICYSCGRVLPKGGRSSYRLEQQFSHGSKDTTYKMAKKPSKRGLVQTHSGRKRNIMKRRKNRFRSVVMLFLVAFVMLSPQAREHVLGEFGGIDEYLQAAMAPYHIYPVEASYTLSKVADVQNNAVEGHIVESILIPPLVTSAMGLASQFDYSNGDPSLEPTTIQKTELITMVVGSQSVNVPIDGMPSKEHSNRITTSEGHEIWWPSVGQDDNECSVAKCVKVKMNLGPNEATSYAFNVQVTSYSYTWWNDARVKSIVPGKSMGINVDNSGTFDDYQLRNSQKASEFGTKLWYDRGGSASYAINGQDAIVKSAADQISSSLPEGKSDNAYAFSRASFDYLHAFVEYDKEAPVTARSGPACLAGNLGDCDEQTNAYFSILRTKGVPGWYTFGILGNPHFTDDGWEAHAWGYIQLPLSESWCEDHSVTLETCFVEAPVDVVNNKWLITTPTAYIDWVETADPSGQLVYDYYHQVKTEHTGLGGKIDRTRNFLTTGDVDIAGGSYQVKKYAESFS